MLYYIFICFLIITASALGLETEVVVLRANRRAAARLPCGQGKVFLDGADAYVLWLKNDNELLYRFPKKDDLDISRKRLVHDNRDKKDPPFCHGDDCDDGTSLYIRQVGENDAGIYRCRVHYQASPSVDYVIELRLVDSPGWPRFYDENGNAYIKEEKLDLGSKLIVICEVDDTPDTQLYWYRNGVVEGSHTSVEGKLRAELRLPKLTRDHSDARYWCVANNADVSEPHARRFHVQMRLPPLSVEIRLNNNLGFEAGVPRVVDCVVVGCSPQPSITWLLDGTRIKNAATDYINGNYTVSSLTLAPPLRDDTHQQLVCRAYNALLDLSYDDTVTLNVGLRPTCITSREKTIGVVVGETENLTCVLEASPEPLQFSWTFPDSRTLYTSAQRVPGYLHRYSSSLMFVPRDGDTGPILCRATNSYGESKRACSFGFVDGGAPQSPECVVSRSYPNAARVECEKGWDGGRPQTLHIELYSSDGTLVRNESDPAGSFLLLQEDVERNLSAIVYASTVRGQSEKIAVILQPYVASAISSPPTGQHWALWLQVIAGSVVAVLCVAVLTWRCVVKRRLGKRQPTDISPDLLAEGAFHREPDFAKDERPLGTTNITVNQMASCQYQYSPSPLPTCRVMVGCSHPPDPATQHSYFV